MKNRSTVFLLLVFAVSAVAQKPQIKTDFTIDTEWRGEVIKLPPSFAPDMTIEGVEDIRFMPGMFQPEQADFFSYLFVITSTTGQKLTQKLVHDELLVYYKGLAKAVSKGVIDPSGFTMKLSKDKKTPEGLKAAYTASVDWVEPFKTNKKQTLHFEVHVSEHNGKDYMFVCVSPQKPGHAVWKDLHKVRGTFKVKEK
jgi:hypothetical protein